MRSFLTVVLVCIVVVIGGAVGYSFSGLQDVSAATPDNPALGWFLHNTFENSIKRDIAAVTVPADLETAANVRAGAMRYNEECIYCHGAPGQEPTGLAKGLNPPPPSLLAAERTNGPARMFWIIKNGVRMSGMPAWGKSFDDAKIWSLAAFLHQKHGISQEDYDALVKSEEPKSGG